MDTKIHKQIAERASPYFPMVERALAEVKNFILEHGYILYGGMAIDLALKEAGHPGIYGENEIPDFDFMTPDFYNDSNKLADILVSRGFNGVSSINAVHITSRRVRIHFIPVADITYTPPDIYKIIPTITVKKDRNYAGLRIVHPDWQRMDIHQSFTTAYANPPQEVIFFRLEKDSRRFSLLDEYYPIDAPPAKQHTEFKYKFSRVEGNPTPPITGVIAYALLQKKLRDLCTKYMREINAAHIDAHIRDLMEIMPAAEIEILKDGFVLKMDKDYISLASMAVIVDSLDNIGENPRYYSRYMDNLRPPSAVWQKDGRRYEAISRAGIRYPFYKIDGIPVVFPQAVLLYFLQNSFQQAEQEKYRYLYRATINMVAAAEAIFLALREHAPDKWKKSDIPFMFPIHAYGDIAESIDHVYGMRERMFRVLGKEKEGPQRPPFGYHPGPDCEPGWQEFKIEDNLFYQINGAEINEPWELKICPLET